MRDGQKTAQKANRSGGFRTALLALSFLSVFGLPIASFGEYVPGELPAELTNPGEQAWVPTDPKVLKNTQVLSREVAKLSLRNSKCHGVAARNFSNGKATGLEACLTRVRDKYLDKLEKIRAKEPGALSCHDYATEPDATTAYVKDSLGSLLCASPGGAFLDGVVAP